MIARIKSPAGTWLTEAAPPVPDKSTKGLGARISGGIGYQKKTKTKKLQKAYFFPSPADSIVNKAVLFFFSTISGLVLLYFLCVLMCVICLYLEKQTKLKLKRICMHIKRQAIGLLLMEHVKKLHTVLALNLISTNCEA
jgi:hypothetical protein